MDLWFQWRYSSMLNVRLNNINLYRVESDTIRKIKMSFMIEVYGLHEIVNDAFGNHCFPWKVSITIKFVLFCLDIC